MKLSVSTIAMLLTKPEMLFNGANVEAIELGRMIHQKVYPRAICIQKQLYEVLAAS